MGGKPKKIVKKRTVLLKSDKNMLVGVLRGICVDCDCAESIGDGSVSCGRHAGKVCLVEKCVSLVEGLYAELRRG